VNTDLWQGAIGPNGEVVAPEPEEDEFGPDEFESPEWHSSVSEEERDEISEETFWKSRPVLEHIHTFARARIVAPWALLGCVLARVLVTVSPQVQLPPLTGGRASLNLFVALSGPSGSGKDAAYGASEDCMDYGPVAYSDKPLGTGEGLAAMFVRWDAKAKEMLQYNEAALVFVGEVDTLGAISGRQGSTILPMLRQGAMGQTLGFSNAHDDTTRIVQSHKYRLCLVAGMQPSRSGVLLNDRNGGTPQRFIYMPTVDPQTPDHEPDEPPRWSWERPSWPPPLRSAFDPITLSLPAHVKETIRSGRRAGARGETPPVDSHSMLTREKVAAGLAILDGRTVVTDDDWALSGVIMTVSDRTRAMCAQALKAEAQKENLGKALAEAERAVVVHERMDEEAVRKVTQRVKTRLAAAGGAMAHSELRRALRHTERPHMEAAVSVLLVTGDLAEKRDEYHGRERVRYVLT
jgi:hypothetical protein